MAVATQPPVQVGPDQQKRRRRLPRLTPRFLIVGGVVALIAYLVLGPLIYILWATFFDENGFTAGAFARAYGAEGAGEMIRNSIIYAVGSTILAVTIGTAQAYIYVRTDAPFKRLLFATSLIPLVLPAVLYAPAWVVLASERIGMFNSLTDSLFGASPFNIYSMEGMIWVEGLHLAPIAFLFMLPAFRSTDPSLEEAARVSGASRSRILRKVTLPVVRPALLSSTVLVLILGLESFEIPAMIGSTANIQVFTTKIYFVLGQYPLDLGVAGALSVGLVGCGLIGVLLGRWGQSGPKGYQTVTGKAFRPRPIALGRARPWVGVGLVAYLLVAVVAPIGALLHTSLTGKLGTPSFDLGEYSLDNVRSVIEMPSFGDAMFNTVVLALVSATIAAALAAVAAWFVVRSGVRGRSIVDGLAFAPLVIPGIVLGMGVSFIYLRSPLPIYGTMVILVIAYVTRFLPFAMRYAHTAMAQVADELEESALVSGATWTRSFRKVLLPLIWPGVLSAWIFVFMVSFRELSASVLLFSEDTVVLSILLYQQYSNGFLVIAATIGVLMVLVMMSVIMAVFAVGRRVGVRID